MATAAERLDTLLQKEQAIAALDAERRASAERAAALEATAAERLNTLLQKEQAIAALDAQLGDLRARLMQVGAERDRLQQEAFSLAERVRRFEEETWREYLSRRWERQQRPAAR